MSSVNEWHPEMFLSMLFLQRMRDSLQRQRALDLFNSIFSMHFSPAAFPAFHITDSAVRIGNAIGRRINTTQSLYNHPLLRQSLPYLESLLFAVQNKLPCLLVGESGSGKSYALKTLSSLLNVRLYEYNMNTTTDATEILGCFEQVEASRHYSRLLNELVALLQNFLWRVLIINCSAASPAEDRADKRLRVNSMGDTRTPLDSIVKQSAESSERVGKRSYEMSPRYGLMLDAEGISTLYSLIAYLKQEVMHLVSSGNETDRHEEIEVVLERYRNDIQSILQAVNEVYMAEIKSLLDPAEKILNTIQAIRRISNRVSFEWIDGSLIEAIVRGYWVVFDNVNFCNASVLDRLNSLLENNGSLLINECGLVDGKERVIRPHNNFRIFFVMNPAFGEISRAMRNRCVEIFFSHASSEPLLVPQENQSISPCLWDDFDIVNSYSVDDFHLILLLLQTYTDIRQLYVSSLLRLNARYLHRFTALSIEQLERGLSIEEAISTAASSVFNSPAVSEYVKSTRWHSLLEIYHRSKEFCDNHGISSDLFLTHQQTSLMYICKDASNLQVLRESVLLNYLIRSASMQQLNEADIQSWIQLLPDASVLQEFYSKLLFFLNHIHDEDFGLCIVASCLLFMRSKPNLHHIEVVLTPSVHDAVTAETANKVLVMVKEALSAIRGCFLYENLKKQQQQLKDYLQRSAASVQRDHIPLFSNNFDESQLCSVEELFAQFPLFISHSDPVLLRLQKLVVNLGLLNRDINYKKVLEKLNHAVRHMNLLASMVPLLTSLSLEAQNARQRVQGQTLNSQTLGERSVLEVSLLLAQGMLDTTQIQNKTVAVAIPLLSSLIRSLMVFIASDMDGEEILLVTEYVMSLLQVFKQTRYSSVLVNSSSHEYNTQLIAFLQLFNSAFIHFHSLTQTSFIGREEEEYRQLVTTILQSLHIYSNISMDNKLWSIIGRPLMSFQSEAFSLFMKTLGKLTMTRFMFSGSITPSTLIHTCGESYVLMSPEEKRTVVEAMATLVWLSQSSTMHVDVTSGVVTVKQLHDVLTAAFKKYDQHLKESVHVIDTTFQGSVELGDEGASEVVYVKEEAFSLYRRLLFDVALLKETQKEQVRLLPLLFQDVSPSVVREVYEKQLLTTVSPPEQLLALRQIGWQTDVSMNEKQKVLLPNQLEYLRLYLENYWCDFALGYHILQDDELLQKDIDTTREEVVGAGLAFTPYTAVNVQGLLSPLLNIRGQRMKNSRDRVELLETYKKLFAELFSVLEKVFVDREIDI